MIKINGSWIKYGRYGRCFLLKLIHIILSKYLNLLYFCNYAMTKILLIFVFICKTMKKLWFLFYSPQFHATKKTRFNQIESTISCKHGFELIRKWCEISCKKIISCKIAELFRKRIYCFVETLVNTESF